MADYGYSLNERREMLEFVPRGASVLDVGCGRGGFGMGLRTDRAAKRLVGVEDHPLAAEAARSHFDEVIEGPYPEALVGRDETFDCVAFIDVLEHFVDPWQALRDAKPLLAPGGVVVASIPNVRLLDVSLGLLLRGNWQYQSEGILDRTHLRFFTRRSILQMFELTGFDIQRMQAINPLPRYERVAGLLRDNGRVGKALTDLVHLQFAVVAKPTG